MLRLMLNSLPTFKPMLSLMWLYIAATCLFIQKSYGLVVLQYHHVSEHSPKSTSLSPQQFEKHLQLIESMGFHVIPLDIALKAVKKGSPLNAMVAITFDDGFASIFKHAYPALKKRNWPFTIFLSTDPIDKGYPDMLSWKQIRDMSDHGALILNHTRDHAYLAREPITKSPDYPKNALQNIHYAQHRIETELKRKAPKIFAYPYGEYSTELQQALEHDGWIAFGQHSGPIGPTANFQALSRFPASGQYAELSTLKTKLNSLAFHMLNEIPESPFISRGILELEIALEDIDTDSFQCFYAGQPIKSSVDIVTAQLNAAIPIPNTLTKGRSRINCTARHSYKPQFFWYSKLLLNF